MNPHGIVVNENTNGIVTVNGHSYEDAAMQTENTNFALLVAKHFSEPFHDSNGYGESSPAFPICSAAGSSSSASATSCAAGAARSSASRRGSSPDPRGDAGRPEPRAAQAHFRRHHRNDLRPRQDRPPARRTTTRSSTAWRSSSTTWRSRSTSTFETAHRGLYVIGDGSGITHSSPTPRPAASFVARDILAQNAG